MPEIETYEREKDITDHPIIKDVGKTAVITPGQQLILFLIMLVLMVGAFIVGFRYGLTY